MKAFTQPILPNSQESVGDPSGRQLGVHQTSPAWVLTFVRWQNRVPTRESAQETQLTGKSIREPMVVISDCISLNAINQKGSHTPAMQATLKIGHIDYLTALAPGDFVFVNILDYENDAIEVAKRAQQGQAINGEHDGFKGFYRIQSVREIIQVDPSSGIKSAAVQIQGYAFNEFNSVIYFNPLMTPQAGIAKEFLFLTNLGVEWQKTLLTDKGGQSLQDIIKLLIDFLIGEGPKTEAGSKRTGNLAATQNAHYFMPAVIGNLLGIEYPVNYARDVYTYLFGIQKYASTANSTSLAQGMNPELVNRSGRYLACKKNIQGNSTLKSDFWNQVSVWSIINQYLNAPINEIYNCFRIHPNGRIMPTMVIRQIPFSSPNFKGESTQFLSLPRWKISPDMVFAYNLGRDEALRINFVQVFASGRGVSTENFVSMSMTDQIVKGNFDLDEFDIRKHGLRPVVIESTFDVPTSESKTDFKGPEWAKLLGDAMIGGHLKMSGQMTCVGIQEPIAVGDNLEFDGIVYHIESINHSCSVGANGEKSFKTSISLSNGVEPTVSKYGNSYAKMRNVRNKEESKRDYANERILPGISDSQYSFGTDGIRQDPDALPRSNTPPAPFVAGEPDKQVQTTDQVKKKKPIAKNSKRTNR